MIEPEECKLSKDQVLENIDEMEDAIDRNITEIRELIASQEISLHQSRVIFHALDIMLKERLELAEAKELALFEDES